MRKQALLRKPYGKDHVLPDQLTLFPVECPACGRSQGQVTFVSKSRAVVCVRCGAEAVEVWSSDCGGRSGTRQG